MELDVFDIQRNKVGEVSLPDDFSQKIGNHGLFRRSLKS